MSNMINPWLVQGYVDETDTGSAQGCYTGSDYWDIEQMADNALARERECLQRINALKKRLAWLKDDLERAVSRGFNRKEKWTKDRIAEVERELDNLEIKTNNL